MTRTGDRSVDRYRIRRSILPLLILLAVTLVASVLLVIALDALAPASALPDVGAALGAAAVLGPLIAIGVTFARDVERSSRGAVGEVARTLGLRHEPRRRPPEIVQLAAGRGMRAVLYSVLETPASRPVTIANFSATVALGPEPVLPESRDRRRIVHRGVITAALDRTLPHIVLLARTTGIARRVAAIVAGYQRVSVGALDAAFTVYCPEGYERDALYLLTPDVIADLLDHFSGMDVHLIDDLIVAVSRAPFDLTDAAVVRRLLESAVELQSEFLGQAARYRDGRVAQPSQPLVAPNPAIAPAARRLRPSTHDLWMGVVLATLPLAALVGLVVVWVVAVAG